jgi:hypothetical protein
LAPRAGWEAELLPPPAELVAEGVDEVGVRVELDAVVVGVVAVDSGAGAGVV